jgi:hypothetical protein
LGLHPAWCCRSTLHWIEGESGLSTWRTPVGQQSHDAPLREANWAGGCARTFVARLSSPVGARVKREKESATRNFNLAVRHLTEQFRKPSALFPVRVPADPL